MAKMVSNFFGGYGKNTRILLYPGQESARSPGKGGGPGTALVGTSEGGAQILHQKAALSLTLPLPVTHLP